MRLVLLFVFIAMQTAGSRSAENLFRDSFPRVLDPGWSWIRENPSGWRLAEKGLQIQVEPGNMWGPENSGKNVLARMLPSTPGKLEVTVSVENRPTEQYEQVDLVWYVNDSYMVKIGQELVDGVLSIVMGREEGDQARTIAIIPIKAFQVDLKFLVEEDRIQGFFRENPNGEWKRAGECDLPKKEGDRKITIQCYQGPGNVEHWATLSNFKIEAK